ncbi:hypothetical protein [Aquidulcibacter sp.]|uniref:hypothetical protein n=1 Tax=Aquidulcibacter sp. TaxID=2052990 RepID=UPI003BA53DD1
MALKRRTILGAAAIGLVGFTSHAGARAYRANDWSQLKALANFRQAGPDHERFLKVTNLVWSTLGQKSQALEVGLFETDAVAAEVLIGGKAWVTTGFLAACQSEVEVAAWFCQRALALQTNVRGEELDRNALKAHLASGYDPRATLALWTRWASSKKLRNSSRFTDIPRTSVRLGKLRVQIEKLGYLF